mmetsp:Transcript_96883/g.243002  ORF Transcript_96883/g.243002 Transcript_96883/m.243002 type:complete len:214 (+) Transcript_96883:455-1096(+)
MPAVSVAQADIAATDAFNAKARSAARCMASSMMPLISCAISSRVAAAADTCKALLASPVWCAGSDAPSVMLHKPVAPCSAPCCTWSNASRSRMAALRKSSEPPPFEPPLAPGLSAIVPSSSCSSRFRNCAINWCNLCITPQLLLSPPGGALGSKEPECVMRCCSSTCSLAHTSPSARACPTEADMPRCQAQTTSIVQEDGAMAARCAVRAGTA